MYLIQECKSIRVNKKNVDEHIVNEHRMNSDAHTYGTVKYIRHRTWTLTACVVRQSPSSRHARHSHLLCRTNSAHRLCTPNYNTQGRSQCMHRSSILHETHGCILDPLTFKALHTAHPPYLTDLLRYHKPTRSTCSNASHLLSVPWHNLSFGSRAFRISALKIWNSLSRHILQSQTLSSFRYHLHSVV